MCLISVVMGYAETIPIDNWDRSGLTHLQQVMQTARAFDAATAQPHCEDPAKVAFEKRIMDRLDELERKMDSIITKEIATHA